MSERLYQLIGEVNIPRMVKIRQQFEDNCITNVSEVVRDHLESPEILKTITPGMRIALTAGSRPIQNIVLILKTIVAFLSEQGACPFLVPAMGSHGGATSEGQVAVLKALGITEESIGCPILATMETVCVGHTALGQELHVDRFAYEADGIVVINKIRPHTGYSGTYGSGLLKMLAVGLGKQHGAAICHDKGAGFLEQYTTLLGQGILDWGKVLFGVGIVENAYHQTYQISVIPAAKIPETEALLYKKAHELLPHLLFDDVAVLVLDEIGKNISGDGSDPYITTRFATPYVTCDQSIQKVAVLDLSEETGGIMLGLGWADVCTKRLFAKSRLEESYVNAVTSTILDGVRLPMILKNDYYAISACIRCSVGVDRENIRMIRLKNTLQVYEIEISESMLPDARKHPRIEILSEPYELPFDQHGNLL